MKKFRIIKSFFIIILSVVMTNALTLYASAFNDANDVDDVEEIVENIDDIIDIEYVNTADNFKMGDVNRDGKVNIIDATCVQKFSLMISVKDIDYSLCDVNNDNKINIIDATIIQKIALRIVVKSYSEDCAFKISDFEKRVVQLVNEQRALYGYKPLKVNKKLCIAARLKSQDMIDNRYFGHNSPKFGEASDMMNSLRLKFSASGENIAAGCLTPEQVVESWMNSPAHKRNIIYSDFTQIGVGYIGNGRYYWTQMFI